MFIQNDIAPNQKLAALSLKYYQGYDWIPEVGHYFTLSRDDFELFKIISFDEEIEVFTVANCGNDEIFEVKKDDFLTGFGENRCWVPEWIFNSYKPLYFQSEGDTDGVS